MSGDRYPGRLEFEPEMTYPSPGMLFKPKLFPPELDPLSVP